MSQAKPSRAQAHWKAILIVLLCVIVAGLVFWNRQYIVDQLSVWQYRPTAEIAAMAERSGMNDHGEFVFYASQPRLQNAKEFNQMCERKEEAMAVLGCYDGQSIYIYNVTDARLDGIREVTAAHEMLHAGYMRLNDAEKQQVHKLIDAEYELLKANVAFAERLAFYDRTEPGERYNELHSIIATEVADISDELEQHYRQYFGDRMKTVKLYEQYAAVFRDLQQKSEQLSQQLTQLADEIEQESARYNTDTAQFSADVDTFNQRAENGDFASQDAFQTERSQLIARGEALGVRRNQINSKVSQYETLRAELQGIASKSDALNRSIDSSLVPAPSL